MTTIPLPLTSYEAEAAAGGKLKVVIRPADPQPRKHHWAMLPDYRISAYCGTYMDGVKVSFTHHHGDYVDTSQDIVRSPAQPGDVIVGLEEWCAIDLEWGYALAEPPALGVGLDIVYRAGCGDFIDSLVHSWFPAATMPPEFSRFRWTVARVECKRLLSIKGGDFVRSGLDMTRPITSWDAAFPAYPWDSDPWVFMHWLGG